MTDKIIKFENADDENLSQLIGRLKRVGAPNDFDFRVRARIAGGKPSPIRTFGIPAAVKFVVPLVLVLVVGAYFGVRSYYSINGSEVPPVAESNPVQSSPVPAVPSNDIPVAQPDGLRDERAGIKQPVMSDALPKTDDALKPGPKTANSAGGGSFDETLGTRKQIYPRGIDPANRTPANSRDFQKVTSIAAKEILSQFGIDATFTNSNWKVDNVKESSLAKRSGLKAGDVIEAINDQPVGERTSFENGFNARSVRVLRDGKRVQLSLKP